MKYIIAIEWMEGSIAENTAIVNNMYDGDFLISDSEKAEAKLAIVNLACAIEVLKNHED